MLGLQRFALLGPSHGHDLEVIFLGCVKVLDHQFGLLLGEKHLLLLPTWSEGDRTERYRINKKKLV